MFHHSPGHPQSLTIRTMNQPSPPAAQQPTPTSPPQQQYPSYPLPIPHDKQAKALQLYKQYKLEKTLSQQPQSAVSNHHGFHLSVPGPLPPRSTTSVGSSRHHRALSISTSAYDAPTDLSSVVSFDDNESPTSRGRHDELMSFDGKKIRQRRRSKLNPTKRAKAALVRCLGSCWVCRSRRVPCPLEHHDIASLEQLWKASEGHRSSPQHKASSSGSNTSQRTTTFTAPKQENEPNASQSDALVGIGGDLQLLEDYSKFDTTLDIQSPGGVDEEQRARIPAPTRINLVAPNLAVLDPNPYSAYQNGQMVAIGVYRSGFFHCQHLDGLCQQFFDDAELLQLHFEIFHFAFTRIDPPVRYICSADACMNESTSGPCFNCRSHNTIEPWIYGHYIRPSSSHRHSPDAQPVQGFDALQPPFSSYSFPSPTTQWETDIGDFTDFNDSGNFTFQNGNAYDGSPYDYDASQGSDNGGQSPANIFGGARFSSRGYDCASLMSIERPQKFHRRYLTLGFCLILIAIASFSFVHNWILSKAQTAFVLAVNAILSHLPFVGFISMLTSFTTCYSAKHITGKSTQSRDQCPFEIISYPELSFTCKQMILPISTGIGIWS